MILTNNQIYEYAIQITELFKNELPKLPIKANFYLLKNKNTLISLAEEIEKARVEIISNYATIDNEGNYILNNPSTLPEAQKELYELSCLEQEVYIYKINIEDFPKDMFLTTNQMESLMFMIE